MLTSQEEQRPGVPMEGWPPSLCIPSTQRLSAGEEAGVYQRYTQLCCPSISAALGDLALKLRSQAIHHRLPAPPYRPMLPGVGWRRQGGERRVEEGSRGWRSGNLDVAQHWDCAGGRAVS